MSRREMNLDQLHERLDAAEAQAAALREALHYLAVIPTDGPEQLCILCGRVSPPEAEAHDPECALALDAGRALLAELAALREVAESAKERGAKGHSRSCAMIKTFASASEGDSCDCGHSALPAALGKLNEMEAPDA